MSFIQNFFTSRDNNANTESYVGQTDRLWYNPDTNSIRVSDGSTPGGLPIDLDLGANATFDIATANTVITKTLYANSGTVYGELIVDGNISPATTTKIGGVKAGPGANISADGTLTIDTAGLPLSFGDFTANGGLLTLVNTDENMTLQTFGNAEIQLVGNIGFYKPDGYPPNVANRYFAAFSDGQIKMYVPTVDQINGAVEIIGTTSGQAGPVVNTGVMLHITGQNGLPSRFYNDGVGNFAAFVGRRINGTVTSPTAVLAGDELIRFSSTGYNGTEVSGNGSARIVFQALENFTPSNTGSNLSFWTAAIGSNVLTKIATIDSANGLVATKVASTGNANVGNLGTSGLIVATGNITGGNLVTGGTANVTGNISTSGNIILNGGNIIYTPRYGSFYSNVDQTNPVANAAIAMTLNNTVTANGVSIVSNSRITISKTGPYNIQFSAQLAKTGGGTSVVDIWLNKNGTPVDWTNTTTTVTAATPTTAAWNFVENVTVANTYYEIMWSSPDTLVLLDAVGANTNPTRPGIPSVIVTVTPVGA